MKIQKTILLIFMTTILMSMVNKVNSLNNPFHEHDMDQIFLDELDSSGAAVNDMDLYIIDMGNFGSYSDYRFGFSYENNLYCHRDTPNQVEASKTETPDKNDLDLTHNVRNYKEVCRRNGAGAGQKTGVYIHQEVDDPTKEYLIRYHVWNMDNSNITKKITITNWSGSKDTDIINYTFKGLEYLEHRVTYLTNQQIKIDLYDISNIGFHIFFINQVQVLN